MPLYYHSWIFYNHFIATLYYFLGPTYWPSARCQFLFFACFLHRGKSISNGVQMPRNFLDIFWTRRQLGRQGSTRGEAHGALRPLGVSESPGVPWWVVGPMEVSSTSSQLYKYSDIPKTLGRDWYIPVVSIIFDCCMPIFFNFHILLATFYTIFWD